MASITVSATGALMINGQQFVDALVEPLEITIDVVGNSNNNVDSSGREPEFNGFDSADFSLAIRLFGKNRNTTLWQLQRLFKRLDGDVQQVWDFQSPLSDALDIRRVRMKSMQVKQGIEQYTVTLSLEELAPKIDKVQQQAAEAYAARQVEGASL